ncbi:MAG TPA: D-glycero-beta-D-manno-heptose 1-phosphate adenylyltransferase [Tepidisphaeraceae bacterium]|jgi:D-beta-D-heptose 7-phosphate kinase/D-beta-D-heptose 1-phosphate adenosyltransferase|nr:D-glycero-beta-D-manno-heptose 1-phosphate adenylyltransferase [Tepidisphaeraceae bacterium]
MPTRLIEIVERFSGHTVVLVGDFMLDRYIFGSTERISPEAPIPVLKYAREEARLGGAGFVLAGLAELGSHVRTIGVVGDDAAGRELRHRVDALGADAAGLITVKDRPTVAKTRFLGSSEDRTPHQMIRLDIEDAGPVSASVADEIVAKATAALAGAKLLCLEDYNKGVLTADVCQRLIAAAKAQGVPVFVDPARLADYRKYAGATLLKPNRPETERSTGQSARTPEGLKAAAEQLLSTLKLDAVVMTLNEKGCYLATADGERTLLASRPRQVADGTGAGDMVLVAIALARAAGADWHDAAALSNVVGGLEVEKLGCVPVSKDEVVADLLAEHHEHAGKQRSLETLLPELARHRAAGRRIVFTNGCFDLIHLGHVKYFQYAKAQGDLLVVGVNTDSSISRLKGPKRPIINEGDRVSVLEELESIDYLVRFDEDTPRQLIESIRPDVLVKGADYAKEQVVGWEFVEAYGGCVSLAPLIDGKSTSAVIQRILAAYT